MYSAGSAGNPRPARKLRASSGLHPVLYIRERFELAMRRGVHGTTPAMHYRAWGGGSAKITLSEAITYVDWAQTCVNPCFYGVGCRGLWCQLPRVLHRSRSAVDCDPASEPPDRNWCDDASDYTSMGNV